jgi:hypothetical protein
VRHFQRIEPKGMSIGMLRQQNMLRHVAEKYSSSVAATCQKWLDARAERDLRAGHYSGSAASGVRDSTGLGNWHQLLRAVAAATRAFLHASHLIQGR